MKYAVFNNERIEATKGFQGAICPVCGNNVVAKCGNINIHHWAHKSEAECDNWWENETLWHRNWKNSFSDNWQERIMYDNTSDEKHIADVKTPNNLIIEFQHSSIKPEERIAREKFYKNMIWVVDGTRLENDYKRFNKNKGGLKKSKEYKSYAEATWIEEIFPRTWINSTVPVFFDFGINHSDELNEDKCKNLLWCLFPREKDLTSRVVMCISKENFVKHIVQNLSFRNLILEKQQKKVKQISDLILNLNSIKLTPIKIIQKNSKELSWKKDLKPGDIYIYGDKQIYKELELIITGVETYYKEWNKEKTVIRKHKINSETVKNAKIKPKIFSNGNYIEELFLENGNKLEKVCDVICLLLKKDDIPIPALITLESKYEQKLKLCIAQFQTDYYPITIFTTKPNKNNSYFISIFYNDWLMYGQDKNIANLARKMQLYTNKFIFNK